MDSQNTNGSSVVYPQDHQKQKLLNETKPVNGAKDTSHVDDATNHNAPKASEY